MIFFFFFFFPNRADSRLCCHNSSSVTCIPNIHFVWWEGKGSCRQGSGAARPGLPPWRPFLMACLLHRRQRLRVVADPASGDGRPPRHAESWHGIQHFAGWTRSRSSGSQASRWPRGNFPCSASVSSAEMGGVPSVSLLGLGSASNKRM